MRILAFDTATRATTVALLDTATDAVQTARDDPAPGERPRHTTHLLALIVELLGAAGGWGTVDRIAVGTGPGTFTGLRIGIVTARALGRARDLPVVGISTLASLAAAARTEGAGYDAVLAVLDARRREVFSAAWAPLALIGPELGPPLQTAAARASDELVSGLAALGPRRLAIGDGAIEFRSVLEAAGVTIPGPECRLHRVQASEHARLAQEMIPGPRDEVSPEYLRVPDAELSLRATPAR